MAPAATAGPPAPSAALARPALAVAAIASVGAGVVHVAAAGDHEGAALLVWMFGLCAAAQLGWGAAVAMRPRPRVLLLGVVINGGAVLVWALTRSVGIPFIDSLAEVEAVGRQDLIGALFAGASVLGSLRVLLWPTVSRALTLRWVGLVAAIALVAALPAVAAGHTHVHAEGDGHDGHDGHTHLEAASATEHGAHDHGAVGGGATVVHDHAADAVHAEAHAGDHADHSVAAAHTVAHVHSSGVAAGSAGHDHSGITEPAVHDHPTDPADPHDHPTDPTDPAGPIISIDDPRLTEEQWNAAVALIVSTTSGLRGIITEEDVTAAGYVSVGDGGQPGQYEHFVNWSYLSDEFELDAAHVESIVMKMNADGTTRVVSAMYILTLGKTMADVPPLAGELTTWHDHDNLCFDGTQIVAVTVSGVCPIGVLVNTPPMLHVWIEANPCGPFAAIDEHGVDCGATHTH